VDYISNLTGTGVLMPLIQDQLLVRQQEKDKHLLERAVYLGTDVESDIIPFQLDLINNQNFSDQQKYTLQALEIKAAQIAIRSLASLAEINELDHLGGGLDLISAFVLTLAVTDYEKIEYTIENAHTSIGYYAALAAFGFLDENDVITKFRRGLEIAGHVAWVPGGTQLNGGRLGVMIPVAVGQALGKKVLKGDQAWVITHCGDAGWISGQALNGFNGADLYKAPITFVMHRNGIQLSGSNRQIMDKDPRPIIEALGIKILEIPSLHQVEALYQAYQESYTLAQNGIPSLIYPVGYSSSNGKTVDLNFLGKMYDVTDEIVSFASEHGVDLDKKIWIPGSLMSYRDVTPMLECVFLVNQLDGGKGHHDGHMKGRDVDQVLQNPMLRYSNAQLSALKEIEAAPKKRVRSCARPEPGTKNLLIPDDVLATIELPPAEKSVSPRAGVDIGYATIARLHPDKMFVISCDLDPSTKLANAKKFLNPGHAFEMSIEEQASALMADGLAMSSRGPQLNVFSTFAAFFEGIAREGFEMWRYQRNLNGINEGLNVTFHMSHVGACTGRDHFSGWGLDWINLAIAYLPYIHRFYAPADARSAFIAVKDLAAHYGGHIIGIPRDNLPILRQQNNNAPLWDADSNWEAMTLLRSVEGAKKVILSIGAPAFLAVEAFQLLAEKKEKVDVYVVNGLPLDPDQMASIFKKYSEGLVTIEDGIIGTRTSSLRGFAAMIAGASYGFQMPLAHLGIKDPRIAPSDGHLEVWEHFGITKEALIEAVENL
jgi:transketolase